MHSRRADAEHAALVADLERRRREHAAARHVWVQLTTSRGARDVAAVVIGDDATSHLVHVRLVLERGVTILGGRRVGNGHRCYVARELVRERRIPPRQLDLLGDPT